MAKPKTEWEWRCENCKPPTHGTAKTETRAQFALEVHNRIAHKGQPLKGSLRPKK